MPCEAKAVLIQQQQACWIAGQLCFQAAPASHVMLDAGLQVGVVRQIETAAIKKTSENRNTPFTRELTAVYTRATLEVGLLRTGSSQPLQATHHPPAPPHGCCCLSALTLSSSCIPAQGDGTAVSRSPGSCT